MKYIYRKLLLLLAVVTFLVAAPLVVLYSMGYRLSLLKGTAPAVGVLLVESIPESVNLDVNDRYIGRTPRAVPNLEPGLVKVKLSETGYVDWRKSLPINPAMATTLWGVRLFPSSPSSTILASNIESFVLSPNRNLLAILEKGNSIHLLDYKGEVVMPPKALSGLPVEVLWSTDSSMIAMQYEDSSFAVLDIARPLRSVQIAENIKQVDELAWDPRVPGRLLVLTKDNKLFAYSTASGSAELLIDDIKVFGLGSRHIFAVDIKERMHLYSLDGRLVKTYPIEFDSTVKALLVTPAENVAIRFANNDLALLQDDDSLHPVASGVIRAGWSPDGHMLYMQLAQNEIHIYNFSNKRMVHIPLGRMQLVNRLSKQIVQPQWFAGGHHLIYQADGKIYITEIDTRDYPVSYMVSDTGVNNAFVAVGKDGEVVYYISQTERGQIQLVETSLLVK